MIKKNPELSDYLKNLLIKNYDEFLSATAEMLSIRSNDLKSNPFLEEELKKKGFKLLKINWAANSFFIQEQPFHLSQTLYYFLGQIVFQGASSQLPAIILNPKPGEKVLDMTAAPGSKSTQLAALMQNSGQLFLNDSNWGRIQALNANTQRVGMYNQLVYNLFGERLGRLFPEYFDKVLLDTPCSGLGTLATHKEIYSWWSLKRLNKLMATQEHLLIAALKAVKPGGHIVYSTCSVAPEENEQIIDAICKKYPVKVKATELIEYFDRGLNKYNNITFDESINATLRVWPHVHNMEGFFVALLEKTDHYSNDPAVIYNRKKLYSFDEQPVKQALEEINSYWGIDSNTWLYKRFYLTKERIWMLNDSFDSIPEIGFSNGGMLLAEKRGHLWKLTHQAVQFLSKDITRRYFHMDKSDIKKLFWQLKFNKGHDRGYYALQFKNEFIGTIFTDHSKTQIKLANPMKLPEL